MQLNPWLTTANKQLEFMHRYLGALGLFPSRAACVDVRWPGRRSKLAGLFGAQPKPWE